AIRNAFGRAEHHVAQPFVTGQGDEVAPFFLRVRLTDKPGTLAALTEALAEEGVSVDKLLQDSADESGASPVAVVTHRCPRNQMLAAISRIEALGVTVEAPRLIRIEAAS
ncbi:MAG: ACT domain-containing protein, partial [Hyphomonas sp.]